MAAQRYEISLSVAKYLDKPACLHFMINLSIKLNFNSPKDQHKNSEKTKNDGKPPCKCLAACENTVS